MRNVYHHFGDPGAMNASLFKSLKPGGSLAVQDFGPPPGAESATPSGRSQDGHHGVTPATVERELKAAGFDILSSSEWPLRAFMVVARRPVVECPQQRPSAIDGPRTGTGVRPQSTALPLIADCSTLSPRLLKPDRVDHAGSDPTSAGGENLFANQTVRGHSAPI